jgi:hypothetical protein
MPLLTNRLSPTFIQEAASSLNVPESRVRKGLQRDVDSGVCATILAIIDKPVVRWAHYAKVAKFVGRRYAPLIHTATTSTASYDTYLINYFKEAANA